MSKNTTLIVDGKEVSKSELKEKFNIYNKQFFGGKLGKCEFFWLISGKGFYGKYTDNKSNDGGKIGITRSIQWTEEDLKELLVHEMIHMYVSTVEGKKHDGLLGHGKRFRAHCKRLKDDFGLTIRIHGDYGNTNKKLSPKLLEKVILWVIDR